LTTKDLFKFEISIITNTCELFQKYYCTRLIQLAKIKSRMLIKANKSKFEIDPANISNILLRPERNVV